MIDADFCVGIPLEPRSSPEIPKVQFRVIIKWTLVFGGKKKNTRMFSDQIIVLSQSQ